MALTVFDTNNPPLGSADCPACDWPIDLVAKDIDNYVACPECGHLSRVDYDGGEPPSIRLHLEPRPSAREIKGCIQEHEERGC